MSWKQKQKLVAEFFKGFFDAHEMWKNPPWTFLNTFPRKNIKMKKKWRKRSKNLKFNCIILKFFIFYYLINHIID